MALAIFDLDNTLLADDSDYLWGLFLADQGLVERDSYLAQNRLHYEAYQAGQLDITEFLAFSLRPLAQHPIELLCGLRDRFVDEIIAPVVAPGTPALLARHRQASDTLLIVTATNRFVTGAIASRLGVAHLLATEVEIVGERFTGKPLGTPCYRQGKISRVEAWLRHYRRGFADSWFYSDSHNDLPLLERVAHPYAVNPDAQLAAIAREKSWPMISLRD